MTETREAKLARAAQLRADADTMRKAAEIHEVRNNLQTADIDRMVARSLIAEADEANAEAAEPVDPWADAKGVVDHICRHRDRYISSEISVANYFRHLQSREAALTARVAELEAWNAKEQAAVIEVTTDCLNTGHVKSGDKSTLDAVRSVIAGYEAELATKPKELWMIKHRNSHKIHAYDSGFPVVYLGHEDARILFSDTYEVVPYDGRKAGDA